MDLDYPEEIGIKTNQDIINNVLKEKVFLKVSNFSLEEDFENNCSYVSFTLSYSRGKTTKTYAIKKTGLGSIDGLFTGIINQFADTYISLQDIFLYDFLVKVNFKESKGLFQTDAPVEVKIVLQGNTRSKNKLYFKAKSNSIIKSGIGAVCNAVEYLINAELVVVQLAKDIKFADKRQRMDLKESYTHQLSEFVKFISYAKVINNLNKN